ncbi:MAG: FkbM family methyltransferase [Longimicrobiales bacterium]
MALSRRLRKPFRRLRIPAALKRVTDALAGGIPIRIRSGVNAGMRWSLASAGSGYGSGRRAARQMELIAGLVRRGDVVWDVGAHHGYVTLCAARRAGEHGEVHAFEPSARSCRFLERHVEWNELRNVRIHPFALSSFDGQARLGGGSTSKQHTLGAVGEPVNVRRAVTLIESGACSVPEFIKIDIEGAEADLLRDALPALGAGVRLLVAIHSAELCVACREALVKAGYRVVVSARARACLRGHWRGDADLFCFGPAFGEAERDLEVLERAGF